MREFLRFIPYVVRTARRARSRTILTVVGAAVAMGLFAFVRTVDQGVADLDRRASQPVLVVFQDSRFCPLTSYLPVRYADEIRRTLRMGIERSVKAGRLSLEEGVRLRRFLDEGLEGYTYLE